jgi:predicted DNA-binding protein (MmcQ/YjbR family)
MKESQASNITTHIRDEYGAEPEFLWPERYPTYCIFRHGGNKKWFALIGRIEWKSLGRDGKELVDIINLKFDNGQALDFAENTPGVYPAYHMNKKHWITIALDGTLSNEMVMELVKKSYLLAD